MADESWCTKSPAAAFHFVPWAALKLRRSSCACTNKTSTHWSPAKYKSATFRLLSLVASYYASASTAWECNALMANVCLSICLSVRLSVCPSVRPSVRLSVCPRPSVRLSVPVRLSVRPSVRLWMQSRPGISGLS